MSNIKVLNDFQIRTVISLCKDVEILDMKPYYEKWSHDNYCVFFKYRGFIFTTPTNVSLTDDNYDGDFVHTLEDFIKDFNSDLKDFTRQINKLCFSYLPTDTLAINFKARALYLMFDNYVKLVENLDDFNLKKPDITLGVHFVAFFGELYEYGYSPLEILGFALEECGISQKFLENMMDNK